MSFLRVLDSFKAQKLIKLIRFVSQLDSADEITEANALSLEFINKVEQEYHRLSGLLNVLVLKKKSKLEQIRKTAHLSSIVINEDTSDPVAALVAMRAQISRVKAMASERANIVTDIELIQHAYEEVQWYRALEKDNVLVQDARSVKAKVLQKVLTKMLNKVKAELAVFDGPFEFDGVDAESIINAIMEASGMEKATSVADKAFTSVEKTLEKEKTGTSTEKTVVEHEAIGAEAPGVEDMEPGSEQAAGNLLPFLPQFGRKAPRTPRPRRPAQEVPHSPSPPDYKKSDESMRSSPSEISDDSMGSSPSEKSDDSMRSSPSVRSDDSMRSGPSDPDDSDYNPEEDV